MRFPRYKIALHMTKGGHRYAIMVYSQNDREWFTYDYFRTPQEAEKELQELQMHKAFDVAENRGKPCGNLRAPVKNQGKNYSLKKDKPQ